MQIPDSLRFLGGLVGSAAGLLRAPSLNAPVLHAVNQSGHNFCPAAVYLLSVILVPLNALRNAHSFFYSCSLLPVSVQALALAPFLATTSAQTFRRLLAKFLATACARWVSMRSLILRL